MISPVQGLCRWSELELLAEAPEEYERKVGGLESGLLQTCDDSSLILKPSHPPRNPPLSFLLRIDSSRLANCVKQDML